MSNNENLGIKLTLGAGAVIFIIGGSYILSIGSDNSAGGILMLIFGILLLFGLIYYSRH